MVFANNSAFVAFLVIIISLVVAACMLVWMWFCYYPGGYKKDQVMDIGEYSMFVAQTRIEQRKKKQQKKGGDGEYDDEDGGYDNDYDELYYEMGKDGAAGGGNADWQSVGTSEQQEDLEGGEFYDGGASSPSTRSMSDAGATTPSSTAPSQRGGLKSALKTSSVRDDRSESTYVSTTPTSTSGGYY